jgi:hypothetical protein
MCSEKSEACGGLSRSRGSKLVSPDSGDDAPRESIAGTVTLDGKPLVTGTIRFFPARRDSSGFAVEGGDTTKNGKFSISRNVGLVPGTYTVSIFSGNTTGERPKADIGPGRVPKASKELIPFKYNAKSELTADVPKGGLTDLRFDLRSK